MIPLRPAPTDQVAQPLQSVLLQAVASGVAAPPWIALDDGTGTWLHEVASVDANERARGIVATGRDEALVDAIHLGVGGGLWLPPSTVGAVAAFRSAALEEQPVPCLPDQRLTDVAIASGSAALLVAWRNRPFWRCQLGEGNMVSRLQRIARVLDCVPAIVPWPALIVVDCDEDVVAEAWRAAEIDDQLPSQGVTLVPFEWHGCHGGVTPAALTALLDTEGTEVALDPVAPRPVHELPSGRRVGWWSTDEAAESPPDGWFATPCASTREGHRWRLSNGDTIEIEDTLASAAVRPPAVRMPGWAASAVCDGSPAGLLVERLAAAAAKLDVPLWVPNVARNALQNLLRLPCALWVDGPAVPRAE